MPKNKSTNYSQLSDQELVLLIKENQDYLGEVYKRCKQYSISFLRKMTGNKLQDYELDDVFHDSILVLYEKIIKGNFVLTCNIQTYMNSVCRNIFLKILEKGKFTTGYIDNSDNDDSFLSYNKQITDCLDEIENPKEAQFLALEKALEKMKLDKGNCYELITQFWYHKKSINDLTTSIGYTNDVNTRNQKSKCQERLRKEAFNEMNTQ